MREELLVRQKMEEQLIDSRTMLEGLMTLNKLHSMQEQIVTALDTKREELQTNIPLPQVLSFKCDTRYLEEYIARLGDIVQVEIPLIQPTSVIPYHTGFQQPSVAVGKEGSDLEELHWPQGVSIEPESGNIHVADMNNSRIQIFPHTGNYIDQIAQEQLKSPYGILIHLNNIYVTDLRHHAIFRFKLPGLIMVKRIGKQGSGKKKLNYPRQLAISPDEHLFVTDDSNHRLQILTTNLDFQGSLRHQTMTRPVDVKFTSNDMFVLSCIDNPCIHVFKLSGEKLRSLISSGLEGTQVEEAFFFCLDKHNDIVISDWTAHNIKVFSQEDNKFLCVSRNIIYGLQIFSA